MVLEPDLDLSGGEVDLLSQLFAFGRGEVSLGSESALQGKRLRLCKQDTALSLPFLSIWPRLLSLFPIVVLVDYFRLFLFFDRSKMYFLQVKMIRFYDDDLSLLASVLSFEFSAVTLLVVGGLADEDIIATLVSSGSL